MTPAIPELNHTDLAVEELVRIVQECGDAIRRRDERAISDAMREWAAVIAEMTTIANAKAPSLGRNTELTRRMIRPVVLFYLCGHELGHSITEEQAAELLQDPEVKAEVDRLRAQAGVKPKGPEPTDLHPLASLVRDALMASPGISQIAGQLMTAASNALDSAEALDGAAKKYTEKLGVETNTERAVVYGLLAVASKECSRLHFEIAKHWRTVLEQIAKRATS